MNLLLAENDHMLAKDILHRLKAGGYSADYCKSGPDAFSTLSCNYYDAAIINLPLPQMDGLKILQKLRETGNRIPTLIINASNTVADCTTCLNAGADDYLAKPFSLIELEARLQALVRRTWLSRASELRIGKLHFDQLARKVFCNNLPVHLTARELDVFEILATSGERIVQKAWLLERLCQQGKQLTCNSIEVNISRLRKKLTAADVHLRSVRGIGYLFEAL